MHIYNVIKMLTLLIIIFILAINSDCSNPNDYKPKQDSLLPPPPPPHLLSPPDSFVHMPLGDNRLLIFWERIEGATIYEVNFVGEKFGEWTVEIDTNFLNQNWYDPYGKYNDKYVWKVRAYGPKWDYYTDWSEPRHFEVRDTFPAPRLLYPPNDTVLYFDSLPGIITLMWQEIPEARFYCLRVLYDSMPLFEHNVNQNYESVEIDSTGTYSWQVRAENPHWEFPTYWSFIFRFYVIKR